METLPFLVITHICSELRDTSDVASLKATCRHMRNHIANRDLWTWRMWEWYGLAVSKLLWNRCKSRADAPPHRLYNQFIITRARLQTQRVSQAVVQTLAPMFETEHVRSCHNTLLVELHVSKEEEFYTMHHLMRTAVKVDAGLKIMLFGEQGWYSSAKSWIHAVIRSNKNVTHAYENINCGMIFTRNGRVLQWLPWQGTVYPAFCPNIIIIGHPGNLPAPIWYNYVLPMLRERKAWVICTTVASTAAALQPHIQAGLCNVVLRDKIQ